MNKPSKKDKAELSSQQNADVDNFTSDLIKDLNREHGQKIAFNLSTDDAPTVIKRWISTGSRLLDYMIANRRNGGLPEGRIIEIYGSPSTGKSHIALQICKSTQKLGGIVVYIDTENATSLEKLHQMGIDVSKRFVFIETSCTEEVFSVIENTILKAKVINKDLPITIVWDSVAATSPKQELLNGYDKDTIGLQARVISKAMRKITGLIGSTNTTLICLNQTRTKVGVMFGDPTCVDPETTKVTIKQPIQKMDFKTAVSKYDLTPRPELDKYKVDVTVDITPYKITLAELSKRFLKNSDLSTPKVYDMSEHELEILSADENGDEVFKPLTHFVVKDEVVEHYQLGELKGTADHRVLVGKEYITLKDHPEAKLVQSPINVVDVSVDETQCYVANGHINHNTTPGGMAIPFHASVRLALTGGSKIMSKDGETALGINVIARTAKNKVAMPFRKSEFEIHFGKGIVEHEQIFDIMRDKGAQIVDGKKILIDGKGAWKQMKVNDEKTGEVLYEKSFYKNEFDKLFIDPEAGPYLEAAFEKIMVKDASNMLSDLDESKDEEEK
jgi:protein RecA